MSRPDFFDPPRPRLIAHRGASGTFPENTLPAFHGAVEAGAEMIELDVHLSADGIPVVIHDSTLERTTGSTGAVAELTAAQLAGVDAGYRFRPAGADGFPQRAAGIGIPTLADVLTGFPATRFTLEIKTADPALDRALERVLREAGAETGVLLACHDGDVIRRVRRSLRAYPTNVAVDEVATFVKEGSVALPPAARAFQVPPRHGTRRLVTAAFVAAAQAAGCEVQVWTVNEPSAMHHLLDLGVDGVMTDHPERLLEVYRARGLR
ncbi:MAG: glycerophosphodiester phosphodiesterase [Gemmatimonadetes bacterium]|nr:glycerophosphodiester phosphodiesterase [Gemmatimonadota bacterium]